ncbi:hypothetical protein Verru16b_00321 [Lacunisphaera limnophila]|uniref:Planctomycete cytochrome C n=1 Tax=Lacunisphaera limnophila TaxID=1838286 RepID=A0A1I7PI24_9BACT|nr:DUF1592 domain-containing protein [Lacunisphaera limnophila]AOS43278.1 hypothetical protein Verru16b_00321 [Lacunisphaera limnophila]
MFRTPRPRSPLGICVAAVCGLLPSLAAQTPPPDFFRTYCYECHGTTKPKGKVSLEQLVATPAVGPRADVWEVIAEVVESGDMPPDDADLLPTAAERAAAAGWVRAELDAYEKAHAGEPGRVTVRRLTSGEYSYVVRDLTGVELPAGIDASSDSVGGEGFTNFGDVQFVQDATLERFLEAAKVIADHAVVGAGPLQFHADAGRTGVELSALDRINALYAAHGFRVASGEGGRPFGLERYGQAFYVSWYYRHRAALGDPDATLRGLAAKEGISGPFAEHIWAVVNRPDPGFPTRETIARWQALPAPGADPAAAQAAARAGCDELYRKLTTWPSWFFARGDLAAGGQGDESPIEFDDVSLKAAPQHRYLYRLGAPEFPPAPAGVKPVLFVPTLPGPWTLHLSFDDVNPRPGREPVVIWRNPRIVIREVVPPEDKFLVGATVVQEARRAAVSGPILATLPLRTVLSPDQAAAFRFGESADGTRLGPDDFAATGPRTIRLTGPELAASLAGRALADTVYFFEADAELGGDRDAVVRVLVSDVLPPGARDKRHRILVGDPASPGYREFRAGLAEYAALLPPNSHGEANPADRDPVPAPFDNTYNGAEHDAFVLKVKYQRNDAFFTEKLVDGADRQRLNEAWNDLFGSWPYHTAYLGMLAEHFGLKLDSPRMEDMDEARLAALPDAARPYVAALRRHFDEVTQARRQGEERHLGDALEFAARAWRRPLAEGEEARLRAFYARSRTALKLDHDEAIKAVLARVLVSPAFLYRLEPTADPAERPLDDWELASRMSFFLWSSVPDEELRRAAAAGELREPEQLARQVRRMTADPKARRLATEFFGQWLGFYRFDAFTGVDQARFPEFTNEVKNAMYDEAVSTFEYIVREGRPLREILHADYTFLNRPLAEFYGVTAPVTSTTAVERVGNAGTLNRGGALRLGSVLTTTSAPLRTSPVKRGDWILRRILGTPTPPPPADAGTLPSDPAAFGGLTLRARLDAHKRNASCANCHLRIDPLGFPLEGFDAIGRSRTAYEDGAAVDVAGEFADKSTISGVPGLLGYLESRDAQVRKTLAKKMIGYALGRTVLASDRALVDDLVGAGGEAAFADLAVKIVSSRQFRHRQGCESVQADYHSPAAGGTPLSSLRSHVSGLTPSTP